MRHFALTVLIICGVLFNITTPAIAKDLETVRVSQFGKEKFLLYLPLYIAMEEGYFAEQGLSIDLNFAGNDDQIFASVASGSVEFGMGDPVFTAIAEEKGFPGKTVALLIRNLGLQGYTNNPDIKPIEKVSGLSGLRIGSFPKPSTTYTQLAEITAEIPASMRSAEIVEAAMGAQLGLLLAGKADIVIDLEPTVSKLEDEGYRVVFSLSKFIEPQAITGLMTTQHIIEARPDLVQGMVNALQKALTDLNQHPEVAKRVAMELFPDLSSAVIERAIKHMNDADVYPESVIVPDAYWQRTLQTRIESGDLKRGQPTSLAVDNSFAEKAVE